ncbi:MAG: PDZ domain-containing protein [Fimbriimonadaceae bacterium]|nr:PDZ domain-containing protein [Fimbriimonadaceae bacterium]
MSLRFWFISLALVTGVLGHAQQEPPKPPIPPVATVESFTPEVRQAVLDSITNIVTKRAFVPGVDFNKWPEFLSKRQEAIEKTTTPASFATTINGALRDFGFSHIRLQAPTSTDPAGSIVGIGITAQMTPNGILIVSVKPGSPAQKAGLKQDEVIMKIDGKVPTQTNDIRGELGQERTFEVKGTDGKIRTVKVKLDRIQVWQDPPASAPPAPTVRRDEISFPKDDIALIRIVSFSGNFNRTQVRGFVEQAKKAKSLILDLRGNGGGSADNMGYLLGLLMPPKTEYGVFVSRSLANRYKEANPEGPMTAEAIAKWSPVTSRLLTRPRDFEPFTGKIIVLINRGSGSASEITAASLREQRGAVLVGTRSAGAVLASVFARIPGGFRLQYPVSDYVTSKGVRLEGKPTEPDIAITAAATPEKDPVLEAALAEAAK